MGTTLHDWLASLDEDRLARLLRNRPDVLLPAPPSGLADLAARLNIVTSVLQVVRRLSSPATVVAQALLALDADLDAGVERSRLEALVESDGAPGSAQTALDTVLADLADHGVAWTGETGRIHLVPTINKVWRAPLRLGRSILEFLAAESLSRNLTTTLR